jgi:hypothetical protein
MISTVICALGPNIIMVFNLKRIKYVGQLAYIGKMRNYTFLLSNLKEKVNLEDFGIDWLRTGPSVRLL